MLLSGIIAKALRFVETLLDFFVTLTPGNVIVGNCANVYSYTTAITPCGWSVAHALAGLSEVGLTALNYVFMGLLSS